MSPKIRLPIKTKEKPPEVHECFFYVFGTTPEEIVNRTWNATERYYQQELERLTNVRAQQDSYINEKDSLFKDLYSRIRYLEKKLNNGIAVEKHPFSELEFFEKIFLEEGRKLRNYVISEAMAYYKSKFYELFIDCIVKGIDIEECVLYSGELREHIEYLENQLRESNIPFD